MLKLSSKPQIWGVQHLHGKSGWNGTLLMVQDFPGVAFRLARVSRCWKKTIKNQNGGCICSVSRVEWDFTNGTRIFRSFRLEQEKRNTSEDFHLFRRFSGGMSCSIWISNRNFGFWLTNGERSWLLYVVVKESTANICVKMRATRAARLFFLLQPKIVLRSLKPGSHLCYKHKPKHKHKHKKNRAWTGVK